MGGRQEQAVVVAGRLARFAAGAGWPADASVLARPEVIEAFCRRGLAGVSPATRGTYRSVLRAWAGLADGGRARRGPGYPGTAAPRPYPPAERAELTAIAAAQRPGPRRDSARVMVAAGFGAGLTASELMALRGVDVAAGGAGVLVAVGGRRRRQVPVAPPYDMVLGGLAAAAGDRVLFRPGLVDRGYKNAVCGFADALVADPAAPRFRLGRARASFICDHIAAGTPAGRLLAVTGLAEAGSLARYAVHVDAAPGSKAAWRARPAAQR
jgi:integrase